MKTKRIENIKGFVLGAVLTFVLMSGTIAVIAANPVTRELVFGVSVTIGDEAVDFADNMQPFMMNGHTYVPLRTIAEALGFEVEWNPSLTSANIIMPSETTLDAIETRTITSAEITDMQIAWGDGLVAISTAFADGGEYAAVAQDVLDTLYGYVDGIVLFKPTIASEVPFRFTEVQAASYFIGSSIGELAYEEDGQGFATNPWTSVRFSPDGRYIIRGETALWMGSVYITDGNGDVTRVEKSMGFYRDDEGAIRILLHHSSVPFETAY